MSYALKRTDYEELFLFPEGDLSPAERERILAQEYPKATAAAAAELRARGLDTDPAGLDYLIKKGRIPEPTGGTGRNRRWTREDIDRAADYLDREQIYVPGTVARMFYNIDPAQDLRAQREAFDANPHLSPNPDLFVMEMLPGAAGVGLRSLVRYRPMTKPEERAWRERIEQAKAGGEA